MTLKASCLRRVVFVFHKTRLLKGGGDEGVGADEAATRWGASVGAGGGAWLGASGAVEEVVAGHAGVAGLAGEDTGVHVRLAVVGADGHAVAGHVWKTGDVKGAELAVEGVLAPGVGDLAVEHLSVLVDGGPGTRGAGGERDLEGGAVVESLGDQWRSNVDP